MERSTSSSAPAAALRACRAGRKRPTLHCSDPFLLSPPRPLDLPQDPEYSILKQRLARRIRYERLEPVLMDLSDMTAVAERVITDVR